MRAEVITDGVPVVPGAEEVPGMDALYEEFIESVVTGEEARVSEQGYSASMRQGRLQFPRLNSQDIGATVAFYDGSEQSYEN